VNPFIKGEKMKSFIAIILFVLFSHESFTQTIHDVALGSMSFTPAEITIPVNDIVRWTNNGGLHNVVADDESFTSGAPSTSLWTFQHTFTSTGDFRYYCSEHGGPGGVGMAGIVHVQPSTGVNDDNTLINFSLKQNYPNPFNPTTTIEYSIPEATFVSLKVYNVTGSMEKTLISEFQLQGNYIIKFDATDLPTGVYFYQIIAGNNISTKRMVLLK
jgi:plastocyanin